MTIEGYKAYRATVEFSIDIIKASSGNKADKRAAINKLTEEHDTVAKEFEKTLC